MPTRDDPIKRLNALFSAAMIAHEAIFEMRRELIARDQGDAEQARLMEESAQIVTRDLPSLTALARRLSGDWSEQDLLHPETAEGTAAAIEEEVNRVEPDIKALLNRQREIAVRLRSLLES